LRVVSFKVDDDLLLRLERYAMEKNTTKSEVIRRALIYYLDRFHNYKPYVTKRIRVY